MWMTVASKLIGKYKWAVLAGALVLALVGSGWLGYKVAEGNCEAEKAEALAALIEYQEEIARENKIINDQLIADLENREVETRIIKERVVEYVEANPDSTNCELDAGGLRLWNGEAGTD